MVVQDACILMSFVQVLFRVAVCCSVLQCVSCNIYRADF